MQLQIEEDIKPQSEPLSRNIKHIQGMMLFAVAGRNYHQHWKEKRYPGLMPPVEENLSPFGAPAL